MSDVCPICCNFRYVHTHGGEKDPTYSGRGDLAPCPKCSGGLLIEAVAVLREVMRWSQIGIDNCAAVRQDASDHLRVRELAKVFLAKFPEPKS